MDNKNIAALLKDTAALLELHGANPFQVRHYSQAALWVERLPKEIMQHGPASWKTWQGATSTALRFLEEIQTEGTLRRWKELFSQTPRGVWDLLRLPGLGPKKVIALWRDLGLESIDDLLHACETGQIAQLPGFGKKTEQAILKALAFQAKFRGKVHYATARAQLYPLSEKLKRAFPQALVEPVGAMRRKLELVGPVTLLIGTTQVQEVRQWLDQEEGLVAMPQHSGPFTWRGKWQEQALELHVYCCHPSHFFQQLIFQTGSEEHLALPTQDGKLLGAWLSEQSELSSEEAFYEKIGLPYLPPELREGQIELAWAKEAPRLIDMPDLKGVFHAHTTASDGKASLEVMAQYCKNLGYAYLGITDHSRSAIYARGLNEAAIRQQHAAIDRLNESMAPFRIFKGIESDIRMDGGLDYPDEVLAQFDFVIASVHTGLKMDQTTATERLLKVIHNPFTTMLGHLTGRLLLRREGFPVDYEAIIDACAQQEVIIEINAHPWRLELDWRWISHALDKGVGISINPDAHDTEGIQGMYYGVCVGRKGGLLPAQTFNAKPLAEVVRYLQRRKEKALRSFQEI